MQSVENVNRETKDCTGYKDKSQSSFCALMKVCCLSNTRLGYI